MEAPSDPFVGSRSVVGTGYAVAALVEFHTHPLTGFAEEE